ncbi:unnamed protein product [Durusdinium trenchii]|uniref:Uncharacterized protein n=1 Tax=Durusdinium trenchii TaxID=1381693 RepID=A0ABP0IVD4_9DINO
MWARRIGAPDRCPSQTRVIVQSMMNGAIGLVVYQYMDSLGGGNLDFDLESVGNTSATCLTKWLRRNDITSWAEADTWDRWFRYQADADTYVALHTCDPYPTLNETCATLRVPVYEFDSKLGYPLGPGEKPSFNNDLLYAFAYTFLALGILNLIGFAVHDLTLLSRRNQNYILDLPAFNQGFPYFKKFAMLSGIPILPKLFSIEGTGRTLAIAIGIILAPFIVVWAILFLVVIITPCMVLLFFRYPVRLSRFAVFLTLLATSIFGLTMTIIPLVYLGNLNERPRYALVYQIQNYSPGECYCGCSYFINAASLIRISAIGAGVTFSSCLSAFRCLKGLRRAQWANLMSVLFPVPVTVYSVFWTTPNGDPIQHRKEGEPVQSEMAFDPFALMDEQPESRYTTVTLKPEFAYDVDAAGRWKPLGDRVMDGPKLPELKKGEFFKQPTEVIGCCGFPCLTGGYQVIYMSDDEEEEQKTAVSPEVIGTRTGSSAATGYAAKNSQSMRSMRSRTGSTDSVNEKRMQKIVHLAPVLKVHKDSNSLNSSPQATPLPSPASTSAVALEVKPPAILDTLNESAPSGASHKCSL